MARKIIKVILFILLAVVVAGGIMTYLRSQKKISSPVAETAKPVETPQPKISDIKQITVSGQGASAQVQIQGIQDKNFSISNLPDGNGFKIQVPNAQIAQVQKLLDKPHPLIKKIEVQASPENQTTAEVIFYTESNVNFLDTQKGDMLTIDFVKTDVQPEVAGKTSSPEITEPAKKSSKSKAITTKASKKAKAAVSKKSKSSNLARTGKKAKAPAVQLQPFDPNMVDDSDIDAEAETLIPQEKTGTIGQEKADRSMDLSAFGTAPSTENIPLGQDEVPTIEPDNSARFADPDANDGFNLNEIVKEEPKAAQGSANLLDAETEMSLKDNLGSSGAVAALPNDQKFDLNKIQANLPALQSLNVQRAGNSTMVTFDREKAVPYKVFRMVNPSRIVVDFKDVKNNLKSDYPRFTGTKISRIETRAYAGVDGQIVRVIMYVDGAPNYKSDKRGNQLVLELQ